MHAARLCLPLPRGESTSEKIARLERDLKTAREQLEEAKENAGLHQQGRAIADSMASGCRKENDGLREQLEAERRAREEAEEHCNRLTGMKFSDRMHAALVSRAEQAEAARREVVRKCVEICEESETLANGKYLAEQIRAAFPEDFNAA